MTSKNSNLWNSPGGIGVITFLLWTRAVALLTYIFHIVDNILTGKKEENMERFIIYF